MTGVELPVLGPLGDIVIDQAVLTNLALLENTVGQVIGLQAAGVVQLTGGVLGSNVVTEDFLTTVSVTSSGPGQCRLIEINLAPIALNVLERLVFVDVPAATLSGRGSGSLGSLLCNLGLTGGLGGGAAGLVNAINNRI